MSKQGDNAEMTIVIAGGSGFLGSALTASWRAGGHRVVILTRQPRREDDVAWMPGGSDTAWRTAVDGADVVVNLAGVGIADKRWTPARKAAILDSRVRATRALVEAIAAARSSPRVLISASGIGIYGTARGDQPITEETPPGSDFIATVCQRWEAEANAAAAITRVVLLRTGVVLARTGGALPQMAMPFRFFAGGPVGTGRQYLSWIHADDWVRMVTWVAAESRAIGAVNATAPNPVTNAEFSRALGRAMGRPALLPAPAFALRLAFGELADALLLGGQRGLPSKAQRLGFTFRFEDVDRSLQSIYSGD